MALERALQMEGADADLFGERAEPRSPVLAVLERPLDQAADETHPLDRRIRRFELTRMAAPACPVSGTLGRLGKLEELDVLPQRPPAGAGRPAVNMRGAHGKDERAIGTARPLLNRVPVLFLGHRTHHLP